MEDYDYHLPKSLIAHEPVRPRDASRLLHVCGSALEHLSFSDIDRFFRHGDVLVLNNTKVMPNKLYGEKGTGAPANIIIEEKDGDLYRARVETNRPKIGTIMHFPGDLSAKISRREGDLFWLELSKDPEPVLQRYGKLPAPNYVKKELKSDDHYQTEFAKDEGSLAAPTSGLHFTPELLKRIEDKGVKIVFVTLHISFGTFKPIDETRPIEEHIMDKEYYIIPEETAKVINEREGRLVVCGTTSFKALESAADKDGHVVPGEAFSDLFIYPGHSFNIKPDLMITNFHLPKSTLILFVSAYFGRDMIIDAYKEAAKEKYRFFSLGDACLLEKGKGS